MIKKLINIINGKVLFKLKVKN